MTRLRQLVVALLDEQGFLPHSRTQEARAGTVAPTPPEPGPRTDNSGHKEAREAPCLSPTEGAGAGNPLTDPAADWFDTMSEPWTQENTE